MATPFETKLRERAGVLRESAAALDAQADAEARGQRAGLFELANNSHQVLRAGCPFCEHAIVLRDLLVAPGTTIAASATVDTWEPKVVVRLSFDRMSAAGMTSTKLMEHSHVCKGLWAVPSKEKGSP